MAGQFQRYAIEGRPFVDRRAYVVESDYNPLQVQAMSGYTPMQIQAEGDEYVPDTTPSASWIDISGFIDTVKETVTDKNFLIGGAVGIIATIGISMLLAPKPRLGSRVGSRVRSRRSRR